MPFCHQNSKTILPIPQLENSLFEDSGLSTDFVSKVGMFLIMFAVILYGIIKGVSHCANLGVNTERVLG